MFETLVFYLLQKYFGEYFEGLSVDSLRFSLWKGTVVVKDLRFTAKALSLWNLPVTVKAGFIGTIRSQDEDIEKLFENRLTQVEERFRRICAASSMDPRDVKFTINNACIRYEDSINDASFVASRDTS